MRKADIFVAGLASFSTRHVAVSQVCDLLQATHVPLRVEQYRQAMRRGEMFPPISVLALGSLYVIVDGHKRFTAYKALGYDEILVEVWTLRRWFHDLRRQTSRSFARKKLVASKIVAEPAESARLLRSTVRHWRRIAVSLRELALSQATAHTRKLRREEIQLTYDLRSGRAGVARLQLADYRGQPALLKDFRDSGPLFQFTCGAWMARREAAAYRRVGCLENIPRLFGRVDRDGLLLEFIDGRNSRDGSNAGLTPEFFAALGEVLGKVRERGVLHGDVKRNVLVRADGRPALVDFGASFVIRWWLWPLRGLILRAGAQYDRRAVVDLKRLVAPHLLTGDDLDTLQQQLPLEMIVSFGQRFVRSFSGWMIRRTTRCA